MTQTRLQSIFYTVAALAALVGLGEATYLAVLHLTGATAVCGGSADCFQVLGSRYAKIGPIPVAAFGALAYFSTFSFATFAAFGHVAARRFLAITVWSMFAATLWFLFVQAILLHAFCRYCLFSAALIFLLAGLVVATPSSD
ncbi:MAG: vitamin K epoxide reductase family protein [Chthoniobacterales bacterium]